MTTLARPLCARVGCRIPRRHLPDCDGCTCGREPGCRATAHCDGCQPAQAADGSRLCLHCTRGLAQDVLVLPIRHRDLERALTALTPGTGVHVAMSRDPNLKLNEAVADARKAIRQTLQRLERLIAGERGLTLPIQWRDQRQPAGFIGPPRQLPFYDTSVATLGRVVATHAEWLAARPDAGTVAGELRELQRDAYGLAFPSGTRLFPITLPSGEYVTCPRQVEQENEDGTREMVDCPGTLWTVLRPNDALLPSEITCNAADGGHGWPTQQWMKLGMLLMRRASQSTPPPVPAAVGEDCSCACHVGGAFRPACSIVGGCGSAGCDGHGRIRRAAA